MLDARTASWTEPSHSWQDEGTHRTSLACGCPILIGDSDHFGTGETGASNPSGPGIVGALDNGCYPGIREWVRQGDGCNALRPFGVAHPTLQKRFSCL